MFRDRRHAGQLLAAALSRYRQEPDLLVMALPRGGVPVARPIADLLGAQLDVCLVRKLGVPWRPELALGAVAEDGVRVLDNDLIRACGLSAADIEAMTATARSEIDRRGLLFRGTKQPSEVSGRTVIVVDDGLATGATMQAAIRALRARGAGRIVVAVPVAPREVCDSLASEAEEVVCLVTHDPFYSVGTWYEDFTQVSDREVARDLSTAASTLSES